MQCVDDEFDLPQPIIQHIQSFLDDKQAAQTAAISKSWNNAWSTRPNLQFYDRHFIYSRSARSETPGQVLFLDFVKKTLQSFRRCNSEELLSRSFPCLEDLTMKGCHDTQALQISSSSLKFISLTKLNNSRINFNVPNICKFKYSGFFSPSRFQVLSFQTVSREWESDITLHMEYGGRDDSWVHQLRRFIKKLSMSRIALNIEFRHSFGSYKYAGCLKGTRGPSIDNLKLLNLSQYSMTVDFLDGLLWSCRPKLINQHWFPASCVEKNEDARASNEFIKLLSTRLTEVHKNLSADYQMPFGNQVLDGVNVECFDSTHLEWQLMPWKMLLNDAESPKRKEQIRFKLEWHGKRLHSES